ncbi:hypothetical protein BN1723_019211, partial [Verticillium longisporum]
AHSHPSSAACP